MSQASDTLLLIRPSNFGFNPETAASNSFQNNPSNVPVRELAIAEFNAAVSLLQRESVNTVVFDDIPKDRTPDSIFPNNWVSFHKDGKVVLYPMEAPNRRREKRRDILEMLKNEKGYELSEIIDLSEFEKASQYLEGTGSIVFDHINKIAYVAISSRSHITPLKKITEQLDYRYSTFHAIDYSGKPVYHTNVVMSVGTSFVVINASSIEDLAERNKLLQELDSRQIIEITNEQMSNFAGNMLEVTNTKGEPYILLSATALKSLNSKQVKALESYASLLPFSIPTIEKVGGGSIRCMVAEMFLPKRGKNFPMRIVEPKGNVEFEKYFGLRWAILRKPWNQPEGSERDDQEETSIHRMAITDDGKIAGVARLQYNSAEEAQIRFMAVADEFQGKGVGKKLITALEEVARKAGRKKIFLQARENAVPFYKSMGYSIVEKTFLLFGEIQHFSMEKVIG